MPDTVLVTGGSGFIGTWVLRELLDTGARVVALDVRPATERWNRVLGAGAKDVIFSDVPLTDRDGLAALMKQHDVSHVIHLAALLTPDCQQDPFRGCQVNVLGSTAVFDAARITGQIVAVSYASSYAVYGDQPQAAAEQPQAPPMFYGAFKQAVDLIAEQYWRHGGLRSIAIRPHVVYGPERELGLTAGPSLACRAAVRGEPYTIGYRGVVGYDYVEDVARAFVRGAMECPAGATIVDLPSEPATTEVFAQILTELQPSSAGTISVSGPTIPSNVPPTPRPIARVLMNWRPTTLAAGISKTLKYYRKSKPST
jgi:UDP-glucose 4-epimerase